MVHFVGAGPGAPDLITRRGAALLQEADCIIYAGSLVNPALLGLAKPGCAIYNSAEMTLEQVLDVMRTMEADGKITVRLHTGDPCLYGAIREQMDALDADGIAYDDTPGVSSFCGAAAALNAEYTLPTVSQTVIITRMEGRTPVPEREKLASLAAHGATMVIFLSIGLVDKVQDALLQGGAYTPDTPAAVVYKATWPEQKTVRCTVGSQAQSALEEAEVLCGYPVYLDLVRPYYPEKEYYATGMTKELDRCRWALETAHSGRTVALVCSGDAGVYGMASPLLELAEGCPDVTVEVVPGLTAALSGGAVLGAPLAHDFCVLSLSDRLTPWEVIEKRLAAAAMGDFCMAVYNPSSKGRPDYLARAVRILLQNGKAPDTVCGLVRNIGREGQSAQVLTLAQLEQTPVDMFTTVYIGNRNTRVLQGRMVTPRGYRV